MFRNFRRSSQLNWITSLGTIFIIDWRVVFGTYNLLSPYCTSFTESDIRLLRYISILEYVFIFSSILYGLLYFSLSLLLKNEYLNGMYYIISFNKSDFTYFAKYFEFKCSSSFHVVFYWCFFRSKSPSGHQCRETSDSFLQRNSGPQTPLVGPVVPFRSR